MMTRRLVSLGGTLIVLLSSSFMWPSFVQAHTLKVDGAVGVTVHINPDDEPEVGSSSQIIIGIQDKEGQFARLSNECICAVTILENDTPIDTIPFQISGETAMVSYVFLRGGIYSLEVAGSPRTPGGFQIFSTQFSYRVKGGQAASDDVLSSDVDDNPLRARLPFVVIGASSFSAVLLLWPMKPQKQGKKK